MTTPYRTTALAASGALLCATLVAEPAAAGWSAPQDITALPDYECAPDITADAKGTLHAVWLGGPRESWKIFHASKPRDGAWSAPAAVSEPVGMNPRADVDSSGALHVCWQSEKDREVWHRRRGPDGAWGGAAPVSGSPGVRSLNPDIACDGRGQAYVAWHEDTGENNWDLFLARFDGRAWLPRERVTDDPAISSHAALCAAPDGTLHLAWASAYQEIFHRSRAPSGEWSAVANVSRSPKSSRDPAIAIGHDGVVHVVWHENSSGEWEIHHAARKGGTWDRPRNVSNAPTAVDCYAHVAAGADGAAHVVWHDYHRLYHARVAADGAAAPVVVGGGKAKDNAVCVDAFGAVHAVWQDRSPGSWDVFYATWGGN